MEEWGTVFRQRERQMQRLCGENEPEVFKEWKVMGAAEQRAGVGSGDGDEGRA